MRNDLKKIILYFKTEPISITKTFFALGVIFLVAYYEAPLLHCLIYINIF
jgi:hypothetical protein